MHNFTAMLKSKKKRNRPVLHESISEEHVLQVFDSSSRRNSDDLPPSSPRRRSFSVFGGTFPNQPTIQKSPISDSHGSSELLLSNIESLPKPYRRSNRRLGRLNTQLLEAVKCSNFLEVKKLLETGANPNATCQYDSVSACHLAAMADDNILSLLLERGAERNGIDGIGRTPLHLAAWAGNLTNIGLLLGLPQELQKKLVHEKAMTEEIENELMKLQPALRDLVNIRCELGEVNKKVPKEWQDNIDHNFTNIGECLPCILLGWTPLHAASCAARAHAVRLLLAAGAEPCVRDVISRTPLDVVGFARYSIQANRVSNPVQESMEFKEVVQILLSKECTRIQKRTNMDTPLHTAVELQSLDSVVMLLKAGACPNSLNRHGLTPMHMCIQKRLKTHLQAFFIFVDYNNDHPKFCGWTGPIADCRDKDGFSVLHSAVIHQWPAGVCAALEAGADVVSKASNGDTPLHSAAALGNLEILKEILLFSNIKGVIDAINSNEITPLFLAILKGHTECVKLLLNAGTSITKTMPKHVNVFHIASKLGHVEILKFLLDYDYTMTRAMVNYLTSTGNMYGPIHYAVENNHPECVKLLLSKNAYVSLKANSLVHKGCTPLHIAAKKNFVEIAKIIIKFDKSTIQNHHAFGWTPLHMAAYYSSRDIVVLLLKEGANLAAVSNVHNDLSKTPIQIIMNHMAKPTEFLEEIFDSCISTSNNLGPQDPFREVTIDYGILVPNIHQGRVRCSEMKVIQALLDTGNRSDQRRLLIHPLVESFICLKWKALLPFFYTMLAFYGLFTISLSCYILSVYFYKDKKTNMPPWLNTAALSYAVYVSIALTVSLEILYLNISKQYLLRIESWIKFISLVLGMILPKIIKTSSNESEWPRHLATMALLLTWVEMTLLMSRFPKWGYYVLMFGKVSANVIKILLTFSFLVIGFALCFMMEFHSNNQFGSPWAALVKTMVMMTSEFDYDDLVEKNKDEEIDRSLIMIRLVFLIFLVLGAIVLMNLMVGVAVNDLNDLELFGNIMRLEKQVEFLSSLETLTLNKVFMKIMPEKIKFNLTFTRSLSSIKLRPCVPSWSYYKAIPSHIREAIFDKAQSKKKEMEVQMDTENLQNKITEMHESIMKIVKNQEVVIHHPVVRRDVRSDDYLRYEVELAVMQMKNQIDVINNKLDLLMTQSSMHNI